MRFKDKVVIVTGGNSGIGRGIVRRFVKEGARVAIVGRDEAKGADTLAEMQGLGADAEFYSVDLGDEVAARRMVEAVAQSFGRIDVVVNNAGGGSRKAGVLHQDPPGRRLHKIMAGNLEAAYYVASYAMPHLKEAGHGAIVNISSTATFHGTWGNYGIVKAGVEALTRSLAVEGAPHGIRANSVSPGWIDTGGYDRRQELAEKRLPAETQRDARRDRRRRLLPGKRGGLLHHRHHPRRRWWAGDHRLLLPRLARDHRYPPYVRRHPRSGLERKIFLLLVDGYAPLRVS